MTTLKELMLTDAEIEQIYNDWADQTDTSYDPAKMVAEAQLQKLIDRGDIGVVCPECEGQQWVWVNHGSEGYQQDSCPAC